MTNEKLEVTTDLLGLIYETAHDPTFWPLLLDGLNKEIEAAAEVFPGAGELSSQGTSASGLGISKQIKFPALIPNTNDPVPMTGGNLAVAHDESVLVQRLMPHFKHALSLNREYVDMQAQRTAALTVLDQVPIGVLFVTRDSHIVVCNERAKKILATRAGLCEMDRCVCARKQQDTERLRKLIEAAAAAAGYGDSVGAFIPAIEAGAPPQSVLVVPYCGEVNTYGGRAASVALLVASPQDCSDVSEDALIALFGLTKKEARVAKNVASGMTLEFYEKTFHVAHDTLKSQLKSIFNKTGVTRQSEMVRLILTSPAVFAGKYTRRAARALDQASCPGTEALILRDDTVTLPDGRHLGFAEYGDPGGVPVMLFHGTYGCRTQRYPDDALTHACGVRLIVPERPGFGLSSEHEDRSFISWTQDVAYFADQLQLDRFAIIGHDAGGCYACACALEIPDRLSNVVVVNSLAPFHSLAEYHGIMPNEKLYYALAHYTPSLFARFVRFTLKGLANNPKWYFDSLPNYLGESDLAVLKDGCIVENFKAMIAESGRNSVYGFAQDMALVAGCWDFDPALISIPVHVWHGRKNVHVPFTMGERLARLIPQSIPRFLDGEGHFTLYKRWRELLLLARSEQIQAGGEEALSGAADVVASRHRSTSVPLTAR